MAEPNVYHELVLASENLISGMRQGLDTGRLMLAFEAALVVARAQLVADGIVRPPRQPCPVCGHGAHVRGGCVGRVTDVREVEALGAKGVVIFAGWCGCRGGPTIDELAMANNEAIEHRRLNPLCRHGHTPREHPDCEHAGYG